jgi:hypothetical protein
MSPLRVRDDPSCPIPAASAPAVALLLYCLQGSVAWLGLGASSSPLECSRSLARFLRGAGLAENSAGFTRRSERGLPGLSDDPPLLAVRLLGSAVAGRLKAGPARGLLRQRRRGSVPRE